MNEKKSVGRKKDLGGKVREKEKKEGNGDK